MSSAAPGTSSMVTVLALPRTDRPRQPPVKVMVLRLPSICASPPAHSSVRVAASANTVAADAAGAATAHRSPTSNGKRISVTPGQRGLHELERLTNLVNGGLTPRNR